METDNPNQPKTMNKKLIIASVGTLLVVIVGFLVFHNNSGNKKPPTTTSTETPEPGYKQTESELRDYKQEITIELMADGPSPQTTNIPSNTRIVFYNKDDKSHQIAITPGTPTPNKFYDKRTIDPSNGYPFIIHQTGTFHYYYVDKPVANGTIIVK